ncbi:putative DCC family thiol-disulfide oxidoreductase YuxK [Pontibacter ummariensis]|uniref:Predicted thiol-disulfide oxidoreductase YuxK, DCC family n=1 Tax=Pontibacter ummariensis TaxID=1610492 RepID=A0A239EUQ5_9BACT|nr:DCC1-like thiol-disulfide oxidoreductase family protein [Pontibacter ummariensis]PRY12738.1 putative DCC family thiol-disulfide oxidoreductase YuxK [Pontibacter ummariensis]SNS48339.1 Predicted thiol-disulfide oxidoreductase YuxK, DCC family [Pontibacter ummariensis]
MILQDLEKPQDAAIVFYDGTCGFCQFSIQLVLKHNRKQNLYFASLQSGLLEQLVPQVRRPEPVPDSVLFYEQERLYTESDAVLRIARHLNFPFSILSHFRFIPLSFRNFVYRFIAKHRYKITGRTESCTLPSPEERARFVA